MTVCLLDYWCRLFWESCRLLLFWGHALFLQILKDFSGKTGGFYRLLLLRRLCRLV